jgi:hypothetical protein
MLFGAEFSAEADSADQRDATSAFCRQNLRTRAEVVPVYFASSCNLICCTGRRIAVRNLNGIHVYRLNVPEDGLDCARQIEFEATSASRAIFMVKDLCVAREVEIFEDERRLGTVKHAIGGFWVVSS